MKKQTFLVSVLLLFSSCSLLSSKQELVSHDEEVKKVDGNLAAYIVEPVFKDVVIPDCPGCVVGSSSHINLLTGKKAAYYLHGAEHLQLKNYYFDIPVVYNEATQKWINYFVTRGKKFFVRYSERAGRYAPILSKILDEQGLPRDLIYMAMAESGFYTGAKSWAKAVGPWQFMSYTGRKYGLKIDKWFIDERRDPVKATQAATRYLNDLYKMFGSWELAIAGYNAGEGKVSRAIRRYGTRNFWKIRRGRYLRRETKDYVPKIMALAIIGKNLESFGFEPIDFQEPLNYELVEVPAHTDLYKVSEVLGLDFETIKKYNPELLRWVTPADKNYQLKIPLGKKMALVELEDKETIVAKLDKDFQEYRLRGRASLQAVARKFRLPVSILVSLNNIPGRQKLSPGSKVYLPFRVNQSKRHQMYADLYEKAPRWVRKRRKYKLQLRRALQRGKLVKNPKEFYIVKKGDTLWDVAKKTGVSMHTIIRTNYGLVKKRMIMPGDKLAIK